MKQPIRFFTDYPIRELGDVSHQPAPVRSCEVISFDGDRYATIEIGGITTSIKRGYIYYERGRSGDVEPINRESLELAKQEAVRVGLEFASSRIPVKADLKDGPIACRVRAPSTHGKWIEHLKLIDISDDHNAYRFQTENLIWWMECDIKVEPSGISG